MYILASTFECDILAWGLGTYMRLYFVNTYYKWLIPPQMLLIGQN